MLCFGICIGGVGEKFRVGFCGFSILALFVKIYKFNC